VFAGLKLRFLRSCLAMASALTLLALAPAPAAAQDPLEGNGMWIWYVSRAGGSTGAIASKAAARDMGTVFVKSGDAGDYWEQFSRELVSGLHAAGLQVCAWQFVYGGSPVTEAQVGAKAVQQGADCLVIDAESHYEGRYASADRYIEELRSRVGPDYPVGLTSFPFVDYHPAFPYSVFLAPGAAQFNLPQLYWHTIGTSVRRGFSHTFRFNRPYDAPMFPLGQTYDDPPRKELVQFRQYASEYGAGGVSWWSWQHTGRGEWRRISKPIGGDVPGFEARQQYPTLSRGAAGDVVVVAQQLLRAYGFGGEVDGTFGSGTEADVLAFQAGNGLPPSGVVDAATWRKLLERDPVRTRWAERSGKAAGPPAAPESAALEALDLEIPGTAGSPSHP
jgi:Putative peptidoglycan binding domain